MAKRKFAGRLDPILMFGIMLIVCGFASVFLMVYSRNNTGPYAEITSDGELVTKVFLSAKDQVIEIPDKDVVLELRNNAIGFVHSNCPDQVCVHTGFLDQPGQFAACLPNGVLLYTDSARNASSASEADTTAG